MLTLILTKVGEWVAKYFSYKRLKEDDEAKRELLRRSAESNEAILLMTTRVESNLQYANKTSDERHQAILAALRENCKHPKL